MLAVFSSSELKAHNVSLQYTNGLSVLHIFKLEYLWSQLANLDQILCVASRGWGKGCIRFCGRLDQHCGFHGNRKPPFTYNGQNDVSTFSRLFLIRSFLYLQVTRTCMGERGGSVVECRTQEREVRGSRPTVAVLCPWARHFTPRKYWLITQEAMAPSRHDWEIVDWDVKPQHNQPTKDMHKISDEFEFWPDRTTDYGVRCILPLSI